MTQDFQSAKDLFQRYISARDRAAPGTDTATACASFLATDHQYRGVRPLYDITGPEALADTLWSPLKDAMTTIQRRRDMLIAGQCDQAADGATWVVEMGNLLCDFTAPWLGIPPTGKTIFLPYVTLCRVEGGQIVETVEFLDILSVLTQAGLNPLGDQQTGAALMSPGPMTHDGIVQDPQPAAETQTTYELARDMLNDLAISYTSPEPHLKRFWHPDMNWFGPAGIGASLGFPGYRRGHTGAFEDRQDYVKGYDWEIAVAEGNFAAFMWWPGLTMRNTGGYLGVPANDHLADMRIVDLYRRDGALLAENWIFIDILHFLADQGVDLLADIGGNA